MKKLILIALLLMTGNLTHAQCEEGRFGVDPIFEEVMVTKNIVYGTNVMPSNGTTLMDLNMDFYEPVGDSSEARPLVILCFGGAFYAGSKDSPDTVFLAEELAKRGYATAAIQYRLESVFNLLNVEKMIKIIFMAVQDGKGAVRHFRQDAAGDNVYKIDPDRIFMGGVSAGAILSLHLAYLEDGEVTGEWADWLAEVGGIEGESGNPGYDSDVRAVVSIAGAIGIDHWIDEEEVPVVSMHSTGDGTVNYGLGSPLGFTELPNMYGSQLIHERADSLGIRNSLHTYNSDAHPPYVLASAVESTAVLAEHVQQTIAFLTPEIECDEPVVVNPGIVSVNESSKLHIYPNPTSGRFYLEFSQTPHSEVAISIYDLSGRMVQQENTTERLNKLDISTLTAGIYSIQVQLGTELFSHKLAVK
ncbi:T9SS type A sorting domain-containing protein [Chitinophagales bacterium]|nr:T9SS type A sorting domain-containing protein [Chitinophagales bacterium]